MSTVSMEFKRQGIHFAGLFLVLISYVITFEVLLFLLLLPLIGSVIYYPFREHFKIKLDFVDKHTRKEERDQRFLIGVYHFFFGLVVVLLAFQSIEIYRIAALALVLGDSFSTAIGKSYGKHKVFYNKDKSWEGTFAGFIAIFLGAIFLLPYYLALVIAAFGMFIESLPWKLNDNLTIPIAIGLLLWFIL